MGSWQQKAAPRSGSRSRGTLNWTYPDQAGFNKRGDGCGFSSMAQIIHDFMHYNRNVPQNLAELLREALSPFEWELLQRVAEAAGQLRLPLYIVGGLPRDLILGKPGSDFDLVVEGKAETLAQALADRFGGKVTLHSKFGTAKWSLRDSGPAGCEITTCRGNLKP